MEVLLTATPKSSVNITEEDIPGCKSLTDAIASDTGHSAHATVKKLACASRYSTLVYDGRDIGAEDLQDEFKLDERCLEIFKAMYCTHCFSHKTGC